MSVINGKSGLSLLELSIVIIVASLLLIGASVYNRLTNEQKMNNVISEMNYYKNAFNDFREMYDMLPGDTRRSMGYLE